MSETLYIRLSDKKTDSVQWLVWSKDQAEVIASGELANADALDAIADKASGRKVVVFVSASAVSLKSIVLPAKSDKALRAATPYALEDDLADDVDDLFFAYSKKPKGFEGEENCFVAVTRHSQIEEWLTWLESAGIHTKIMLPDVLALPYEDERWGLIAIGSQILIKRNIWSGLVIDRDWLALAFNQLNKSLEEEQPIGCYSPIDLSDYEKLQDVPQPEELPLALMAQHAEQPSINLLQGRYKVKEKASPLVKGWLLAAGVAAVALTLNMAVKGMELLKLNNEVAVLDAQIVDSYKKAFPETRRVRVSTIRSQLNGKLRELDGGDSSVSFLSMMQQIQPAFANVTQIKPKSVRFDGNRKTIRLQASGNSYQSFDRFKLALEQASLEVTPGAQNNQENEIVGSFTIRSKS